MCFARTSLLILCLAGCGNSTPCVDERPGQCEAVQFAWAGVGGRDTPPTVTWFEDECPGYPGHNVILIGDQCFDGLYYAGTWRVLVAYTPGYKMSQTALAHEFAHAWRTLTTGDGDSSHSNKVVWDKVDRINLALRDRGL